MASAELALAIAFGNLELVPCTLTCSRAGEHLSNLGHMIVLSIARYLAVPSFLKELALLGVGVSTPLRVAMPLFFSLFCTLSRYNGCSSLAAAAAPIAFRYPYAERCVALYAR